MLTLRAASEILKRNVIALLFSISLFTLQSNVYAEDIAKEEYAEDYRVRGYEAQQRGNLNQALTLYSKALSLGLENAVLLNDIGILYEQLGFKERSEEYYLRSLTLDQYYLPAYMNLAYLYQSLGQTDMALEYFKRRYELAPPGDVWAEKAKEEILNINPRYRYWFMQNDVDKLNNEIVEQAHQEFIDKVQRAQEHYIKGQKFADEGDFQEALREFNQALSLTPQNRKILNARKEALLNISKGRIQEHSQQAINALEAGNTISAKREIQKMLTTIPNE